jgi:hypothetical protein
MSFFSNNGLRRQQIQIKTYLNDGLGKLLTPSANYANKGGYDSANQAYNGSVEQAFKGFFKT